MGLYIEATPHTPFIKFEDGVLVISGRSIPEDSASFFEPLFKSIIEYSKNPLPHTEVNLMLEYSNSSTNRALMSVFELLKEVYKKGFSITVNWYYIIDDKEMFDLGSDFKDIINLPFALIEVEQFPEVS